MTFVFPILLGGLALAGIPILLHLIVRQKPMRLPFPAFRFLVQQRRSNLRKLRLRHLLLMALRVFLIVAMCLLLARPRLFQRVLGLDGERPVNAVLVFDTSASMEYRSSDGVTRLDEAKDRARELLDVLQAGSRIAIVDSADARQDPAPEWLTLSVARQRIGELKIRPANAPVTQALLKAIARFEQAEPDKEGRSGPPRLRLLAAFSDWTRGSWDGSQLPTLLDKLDRVPPVYEGLLEARSQIGSLQDMLRDLRQTLPPQPSKDYNEQSLLDALAALQNDLADLEPDSERWRDTLLPSLRQARRLSRDLLQLMPVEPAPTDAAEAFRIKLRTALGELLRATGGAQVLFIDVGMASPVDLALVQIELPRTGPGLEQQVFAEGDTFTLQAIVHATGKDQPATVICQVGDARAEFKLNAVNANEPPQVVSFVVAHPPLLLKPGDNSIEVRLDTPRDPQPLNHRRYATVQVRPKRKVLILVDDPARQGSFARAIAALGYAAEVKPAAGITKEALAGHAAVYLLGVAAPEEKLWEALADYVRKGGGLGIVPAGADLKTDKYNQEAAQKLMPGRIGDKLDGKLDVGSEWNWEARSAKYTHSFMSRFKTWRDNPKTNFVVVPRTAKFYWDVTPRPADSLVLVEYDDAHRKPAVLDRIFDAKSGVQGRVLLLTTPLDKQEPAWNNYVEDATSFYLAILLQAMGYLAGENAPPQLNFTLGRGDPVVILGIVPVLAEPPTLRGPNGVKPLALELGQTQVTLRDLAMPGNYVIEGKVNESGEQRRLAGFSLNIPSEECDLSRVPAAEIEPFSALLSLDRSATLDDALKSYRNEPLDLMPYLMLALLFALAIENLLANKFYRRPEPA